MGKQCHCKLCDFLMEPEHVQLIASLESVQSIATTRVDCASLSVKLLAGVHNDGEAPEDVV